MKTSNSFNITIMALATASWGIIDVGNESVSQLFFGVTQSELPAFLTALVRFSLASVLLVAIAMAACSNIRTRALYRWLLSLDSDEGWHNTFVINQVIYGLLWGLSITLFVAAFQFTAAGEVVFITGLCGFAILLICREEKEAHKLIAMVAFNLFIIAFYLYGSNLKTLAHPGQEGLLLLSITGFVVLYYASFKYKQMCVQDDEDLARLWTTSEGTGHKGLLYQVQLFKMVIQFLAASFIAIVAVQGWGMLTTGSLIVFPEMNHGVDIETSDVVIGGLYIVFATVLSYFAFNYGLERMNKASLAGTSPTDGGQAAAALASLEPLCGCLIAFSESSGTGEPKWYLLGSIVAFVFYMAYLNRVNRSSELSISSSETTG